jgi:hypothetical protein
MHSPFPGGRWHLGKANARSAFTVVLDLHGEALSPTGGRNMVKLGERLQKLTEGLLPAHRGYGTFLQRDYWAVIADCALGPREVVSLVVSRFWEFAPEETVTFRRTDRMEDPLEVGDELEVLIRWAGEFRVRVLHRDLNSITIGTLIGHPEAGRITFGAYRNDYGDVIFHIRSRARSGSRRMFMGFLAVGEPMQTNTWTDFINRLAATVGSGVIGWIHAETRVIPEEPQDLESLRSPTFVARGD